MHRRDIDGLRAVAVCAVIANHFSEAILPGGHLGVDIFFVISGFVITLSLLRQGESGSAAFLGQFYQRRMRRILPALLICVAVSAPLFALFDPAPRATLMTGATSLFGLSNFYLFRIASDYFAAGTKLNGFTHTWSLGVEEQFYLVYPALFWLLLRQQRQAVIILSAIILVSLAGFASVNRNHPIEAFYLLPYRGWELAVGALLARFQTAVRSRYAPLGVGLGIALLCAGLAAPASAATPGTLAAVAGSGLLIHFGGSGGWLDRFLLHPLVQWIGLISYSLYLWHWPVLALSRWTVGIRWWLAPAQLALMLALAALSYRLVEQPWRKPRVGERAWITILSGIALGALLAVGLRGLAHLPPDRALFAGRPVSLLARGSESVDLPFTLDGFGRWQGKPCVISANDQASYRFDARACTLGSDRPRHHALVIGNSFTGAFLQGFVPLIRDHGYAVTFAYSWSASPSPTIRNTSPWSSANSAMWQGVYPGLARALGRGDMVILTSSLNMLVPKPATAQSHEALQRFGEDLSRMSAELRARGVRLVVVHSLPMVHDANCTVELGVPQWYTPFGSPCNFASRSHEIARRRPLDAILRPLERQGAIVLVDLFDLFCPGQTCDYTRPDIGLVYRDDIHPSLEMMPLVGRSLTEQLRRSRALAD